MAKIKKSNKSTKKTSGRFARKVFDVLPLLIAGVILLIVLANMGWSYYDKRQNENNAIAAEQNLLSTELDAAGVEFDKLQTSLQAGGVRGKVTRDAYCYHASRKFETGPLYCVQRLDIVADNSTDEQTLSDFALVYNSLKKYSRFNFVSNKTIQSFDEDNIIFYYQGDDNVIGCSVDFTGHSNSFGNENSRNTYSINIDCLGGDFIKPVYPTND